MIALATFAVACMGPQAARAAEIDAIAAYDGTWHAHIVHVKTALSEARTDDSTIRNECRRSPGYAACEQTVDGDTKALLVFTYDPKQKNYTSHVFPTAEGAQMGSGTLVIAGNTWTFPWQNRVAGKDVYVRIVNTFTDPDTIQFREEFSYDNRIWTLTATGTERRVK
jgi:hypothetical protein